MRTSNPALNDHTFDMLDTTNSMTLKGTVVKTCILFTFLFAGFLFSWQKATDGYAQAFKSEQAKVANSSNPIAIEMPDSIWGMTIAGLLIGFVLGVVIIFKKHLSPFLSPIYAVAEGVVLGSISAAFEARYPGIVLQAAGATFGSLIGLLVAYSTGIIKVTENFKLGIFAATFGIFCMYMIDLLLMCFGIYVSAIHSNSLLSIAISLVIVCVAAFNLVLDFDFIENGVAKKSPKYMEWYGAFGLMVTLIWLYMEILRLLSKTKSRN